MTHVCQPKCDSTWKSICLAVCLSSVLSIQPSAKFTVKMPVSIPVQNFLKQQNLGKLLHTSSDSSVNPSGSLSVASSPFAANLLKFPGKNGEKHVVNYLREILVKSPAFCTLCITSVVAPIHASSIPSVCTSSIMPFIAPICALPIPSIHPSDPQYLLWGEKPNQNYN